MNAKMIKKVDNKAEVSLVSNSNVTQGESVTEPSTVLDDAPTTTEKELTDKDSQYKTLLVGMAPKLSPKPSGSDLAFCFSCNNMKNMARNKDKYCFCLKEQNTRSDNHIVSSCDSRSSLECMLYTQLK